MVYLLLLSLPSIMQATQCTRTLQRIGIPPCVSNRNALKVKASECLVDEHLAKRCRVEAPTIETSRELICEDELPVKETYIKLFGKCLFERNNRSFQVAKKELIDFCLRHGATVVNVPFELPPTWIDAPAMHYYDGVKLLCFVGLTNLWTVDELKILIAIPGIDINQSAMFNNKYVQKGATPLMYAANSHAVGKVQLLLEHHADVHAIDWENFTALHYAAMQPYTQDFAGRNIDEYVFDVHATIDLLVAAGGSLYAISKSDTTPEEVAEDHGMRIAQVYLLLKEAFDERVDLLTQYRSLQAEHERLKALLKEQECKSNNHAVEGGGVDERLCQETQS